VQVESMYWLQSTLYETKPSWTKVSTTAHKHNISKKAAI
jgi:hypothetical protein